MYGGDEVSAICEAGYSREDAPKAVFSSRELADVTFEELQKAMSDGSDMVPRKKIKDEKSSRANKNRPMEVSAKKPVKRLREVIQAPKKVVRDPRFESLCGTFDPDGFKKRYNFFYEGVLPSEKEEHLKKIEEEKNPEVISELKNRIAHIDKQLKFAVKTRTEKDFLSEHKKKEKEAVKKGKKPYYLKKSELRKQKLVEKFNELKESGKLESFIAKRRLKNASKEHRHMPYRRPGEGSK